MGQIFISYSSKDSQFALQLNDSLAPFYDVWIDKDDIKGGTKWEQMIQSAITDCEIFLIVVSAESNQSNWVMRETILAENLGKYRIPILLDDNLPFRLLELQYIDFRGDYSGGLRDLLAVLQAKLAPEANSDDEINRLIGAASRAYFEREFSVGNNLFQQVSILAPTLSDNIRRLQNLLKSSYQAQSQAQLAHIMMQDISILEQAKISEAADYGDDTAYEWSLGLSAPDSILDQVDFVRYHLHPTFAYPLRIIRDRESHFRMDSIGWGIFTVEIEVIFIDGSIGKISHDLTFDSAYE